MRDLCKTITLLCLAVAGTTVLHAQATVTVWGSSSPIGTVSTYSGGGSVPGGSGGGAPTNDSEATGTGNPGGSEGGSEGGVFPTVWTPWFYDATASLASGWNWTDKWNFAGLIYLDRLDQKISQPPTGKLTIRAKQSFEILVSVGLQAEITNATVGSKATWESEHSMEIQGSASYTCDVIYTLRYQVKGMAQRCFRTEIMMVGAVPVPTGQYEEFWGWAEASDSSRVRVSNETKNCIQ